MSVSIHREGTFRRIPLVKPFHFLVKYLHQATKMSGRVYVCYDYLYLKPLNQITANLARTVLHSRWRLSLKIEISLLFIVTLL